MEGDPTHGNFSPYQIISIHSLRMEGDYNIIDTNIFLPYFNPLPPHGGRP